MIAPIGCKKNNRYRGPVESMKNNMTNLELVQNLKTLYNTIGKYEQLASDINASITSSDRVALLNSKRKLSDEVSTIMEEIRHGYK